MENSPEVRLDLVRESDRNDHEELPEQGKTTLNSISQATKGDFVGLTRNIMAQYAQQVESKKQDYREHKPSGVASKVSTACSSHISALLSYRECC